MDSLTREDGAESKKKTARVDRTEYGREGSYKDREP